MFKVLIGAIHWISSLVGTVRAFICMAKCQKRYFQFLAYCAVLLHKHKFLISVQKFYSYAVKQMKKVADKFQAIQYHELHTPGTLIHAAGIFLDFKTNLVSCYKDVVVNSVIQLFKLFNRNVDIVYFDSLCFHLIDCNHVVLICEGNLHITE